MNQGVREKHNCASSTVYKSSSLSLSTRINEYIGRDPTKQTQDFNLDTTELS